MNKKNKLLIKDLDSLLPKSKTAKLNVLMIDDEVRNLRCFKSLFRREANIFVALNKKEALEVVNNNDIDYVFCDYRMPGYNGADILKEIVYMFPKIKRTIVTGFCDISIVQEFKRKSNTTDLIYKPYSIDDILSRLFLTHQN